MPSATVSPAATVSALRAADVRDAFPEAVVRRRVLLAWGLTGRTIDAQIAAGRWRGCGQAVVLHAGPLSLHQRRSVALANAGGRAALTSFTALAESGLSGWDRDAVHLLVPAGARVTVVPWLRVVVHQTDVWSESCLHPDGRRHGLAEAAMLAAHSCRDARPAIGLLAALVQQRLQTAEALRDAVSVRPRQRHRTFLLAALDDIAMGAQALSEIDFAVLCRAMRLPEPVRQAIRTDAAGRRRYLDAEWIRPNGTRVVVEVDGALHIRVDRWWDDQFRQNDVTLEKHSIVLRFPSAAVRLRDRRVTDQLRRALSP